MSGESKSYLDTCDIPFIVHHHFANLRCCDDDVAFRALYVSQLDEDLIAGLIKLSNLLNSDLQQALQYYTPIYKK